jgi:hypothetical protein
MTIVPPQPSYDQNQLDTVLRECPQCRRSFWMRPWRFVCVSCRGDAGMVAPFLGDYAREAESRRINGCD